MSNQPRREGQEENNMKTNKERIYAQAKKLSQTIRKVYGELPEGASKEALALAGTHVDDVLFWVAQMNKEVRA